MTKLEEIKGRANTSALNQSAWTEHYRGDVKYLLSIIEQAERAFEEINYRFELHEHDIIDNAIKQVDDIATEALQAIRGSE